MSLKARLGRLERVAAAIPPPGQLDLIVCSRVGSEGAEGRPPGVYLNPPGNVADVVFDGPAPDPAVLDRLAPRRAPWALTIVCGPEHVPPPTDPPDPLPDD